MKIKKFFSIVCCAFLLCSLVFSNVNSVYANNKSSIEKTNENDTEEKEYGFAIISYATNNRAGAPATVEGDGVRLRAKPSTNSTILELMYNGELVYINYKKVKSGWYYVKRAKTGTWGWASSNYIWPWD